MSKVEKSAKQVDDGAHTSKKQLFSCGVGNFYNDLIVKVMYSFGLLFYVKVAELSNRQAGLVLVLGEVASFLSNIIFGYCCDNVDVPLLSRRIGKRMAWHLVGTVFVAISITLAFSLCLPCTDSSSSWVAFGYYTFVYFMACFWYGAVEIGHITTIPEVAKDDDEIVILNSIRTGFSYFGGIFTYIVSWIVLGQSGDGNLSRDNWKQFTIIVAILTAVGLVFVVIFHVGTKDSTKKKPRRVSTIFNTAGMYSVSLIFGINADDEISAEESGKGAVERKLSHFGTALRKISSYFMPFEADVLDEGTFFMTYAARPSRQSTASRAGRYSTSGRPSRYSTSALAHFNVPGARSSPQATRGQRFSTSALKSMKVETPPVPPSPDSETGQENRLQRTPSRKSAVWRKPSHHAHFSPDATGTPEDSTKFEEMPPEKPETKIADQDAPKDKPDSSSLDENNLDEKFRPRLLSAIIEECHVELSEFKAPKTIWEWIRDPELYKVTTFFVCAYSLESITYAYLALYLMDYLQFKKEATAYFSLVFLISGLIGTALSKKLNQLIGRMWTYCIASIIAMIASGWFYFVTVSMKQMVYAPIVLIGCGVSAMFVMSLSYVAEIITEDKESSGFVYSLVSASHKLTCGAFLLVIQNFYPSASDDPEASGAYIRWVFAVSLALLPFIGLVVMLVYETMTDCCCSKPTEDESCSSSDSLVDKTDGSKATSQWVSYV